MSAGDVFMETRASHWRPWPILISLSIAVVLFATYLAPATAGLWHAIDVRAAFAFNGLVAHSHGEQLLWSFGNLRVFDYLVGVVMLGVLIHYVSRGPYETPAVRGARSLVICVMLVALVSITRNLIFKHMHHDSPSLVLHPFVMLAHTNAMDAKDASHTSFPGDHATVVATFVYLLWAMAGRRYGLVAMAIAIVACMPRLIAGAHWLTDDLVGGLGTALVTVPCVVFTPLGPWLVDRLSRLIARAGAGMHGRQLRFSRR